MLVLFLCSVVKMLRITALVVCCLYVQRLVSSVKITELRVPAHAAEGGELLLGCLFDMEDDVLYSVKWYHGSREFYRYVPRNEPPASYFSAPGITVDMSRSSSEVVTLANLTQDSAGIYRCEVSGETPHFATVYEEKYISIHLLPDSGPFIFGLQEQYQIGDRVLVNCTSAASRPETQLKWWINNQLAPRSHLQGPWYRTAVRPDATETILQLRFVVTSRHFRDGVMKLKCQATIAPLYQKESVHSLSREQPRAAPSFFFDKDEYEDFGKVLNYFPTPSSEEELPFHQNDIKDSASVKQISITLTVLTFLLLLFVL